MKLSKIKTLTGELRALSWTCPGCNSVHAVNVRGSAPIWTWNGDEENVTFSPSVLVRGIRQDMTLEEEAEYNAFFDAQGRANVIDHPKFSTRCHCFVTDGKIIFLQDCSHELAGQTVDMVDYRPYG